MDRYTMISDEYRISFAASSAANAIDHANSIAIKLDIATWILSAETLLLHPVDSMIIARSDQG